MIKCPGCGEENPPKFRLCGYCGVALVAAPPALPVRELRKTVTIIFSDLKGSTALTETLDTEAMHEVKERYFKAMSAEILRHGGKIEKFIGDAIMAVFGLPRAHEDDALRAVRAVAGMQTALERLNLDLRARYGVELANRTGVNTGEVVANDDPTADQKLATGDAVNVAARLEQAAPPNEILLGEVTYRLVRDAVEVESVEPLELKGKSQKVPAYRLVSAKGLDGNVRRVDTPIVGRDAELAQIAEVYRQAVAGQAVRMVTVVGDAGAGKSRLVHEAVERIGTGARVLRGRCLAYGEGITFWPLRAMLPDAGVRDDDSPEEAQQKLLDVLGDQEVVDRLAAAVGLTAASYPLHEVNWAARKVLEILASRGPVVALIDDIHWAEPAFLDLLEHVLGAAEHAPILLLATSRHDLLEERPTWGETPGSTNLLLHPLGDAAAAQVVANLLGSAQLPAEVVTRIVSAAEGNPLYVEQMLSMLIDSGALQLQDGQWVRVDDKADINVPPTIHALLEARLDKLGRAERAAVEPAAVIGLEFAVPAVQSLAPEAVRPAIGEHLGTLTRKQFIRLSRAVEAEPIYRFSHQMVRDTVYSGLLKRTRANLHIGFVQWCDRINADRDRALEFEAILGYHLEQAYGYLRELGPLDDQGQKVGRDAAHRLSNAAKRAFGRGDMNAALNLFQRAVPLLPGDDPERIELLPDLGETLMNLGNFAQARVVLDEASGAAERIGDRRIAASSRLIRMFIRLWSGEAAGSAGEDPLAATQSLIPTLEHEGAQNELATAWRLVMVLHCIAGRYQLASEAAEHSLGYARKAGNDRLVAKVSGILASTALVGRTPVAQAIAHCEQLIADGLTDRLVESNVKCILAQLRAMCGDLQAARALYQTSRATLRDLERGVMAAASAVDLMRVELLGGDLALAEREVRSDYEMLSGMGETYYRSTIAALLSCVVRNQGRDDEALAWSRIAEETMAPDEIDTQAYWRAIRAPIVARAGDLVLAVQLARTAVEMARSTEAISLQAETLTELASVLRIAGRDDEAQQHIAEAIALHEAKGNTASSAAARRWAAESASG